jgi:hypothetical protein
MKPARAGGAACDQLRALESDLTLLQEDRGVPADLAGATRLARFATKRSGARQVFQTVLWSRPGFHATAEAEPPISSRLDWILRKPAWFSGNLVSGDAVDGEGVDGRPWSCRPAHSDDNWRADARLRDHLPIVAEFKGG